MEQIINHTSNRNLQVDQLEALMFESNSAPDCPVTHRFTPGLYTREIFIPQGVLITSQIHKTRHQFIVLEGALTIFTEDGGEKYISAPYVGVTEAGTRRVAIAHESTRWITCHPTDILPEDETDESIEKAVSLIEAQVIEPHVNSLLLGELKNNVLIQGIEAEQEHIQ